MQSFTSSDPKELAKVMKKKMEEDIGTLQEISGFDVLYGIPKGFLDDGQNVADYAKIVHNGSFSKMIPARPFLKTVKQRYGNKVQEAVRKAIDEVIAEAKVVKTDKKDIRRILEKRVALVLKNLVSDNIVNGQWTPNKPSTIARKGSSRPLIDTGQMLSRVDSIVVEK